MVVYNILIWNFLSKIFIISIHTPRLYTVLHIVHRIPKIVGGFQTLLDWQMFVRVGGGLKLIEEWVYLLLGGLADKVLVNLTTQSNYERSAPSRLGGRADQVGAGFDIRRVPRVQVGGMSSWGDPDPPPPFCQGGSRLTRGGELMTPAKAKIFFLRFALKMLF